MLVDHLVDAAEGLLGEVVTLKRSYAGSVNIR